MNEEEIRQGFEDAKEPFDEDTIKQEFEDVKLFCQKLDQQINEQEKRIKAIEDIVIEIGKKVGIDVR